LVEHSPDAVLICSQDKCMFSNAAGLRLLGARDNSELAGRPIADSVPSSRRGAFKDYLAQASGSQDLLKMEEKMVRMDGSSVDVEVSAIPFKYQDEDALQIILHDITERKRFEKKISYLAYYDKLTGLPNRSLLYDRLDQAIKAARRADGLVAVLFLDLDNFKRINDTLGHTLGDKLLKGVGTRLPGILRPSDSIAHLQKGEVDKSVSRLGGDEFVVLLTSVSDVKYVGRIAQRIVEIMAQPFTLDQHELFITTSMGITIFPYDGDDPDTLLKNADVAMYNAKDQGKNTFRFYTQSMNETAYERLSIETNLRTALLREEFLLHYQPQIEVRSGCMVGAEALVRWQSEERGLVQPGNFIPIAEENGLIVPIGEWVLRTACSQYTAWRASGLGPFRMAVNLSGYQFRQKNLVEIVSRAMTDFGVEPASLELELTESMIMQDAPDAIITMGKLKDMGIALTIDDFGTGYSSLSHLKRFPLDSLKIDASFVRDIATNPDDAAITKTIIAMAHNLGLVVVAEGVETEQQLEFLRVNGCDIVQGFLVGRPMPAEEFTEFAERAPVPGSAD
jgi:diguanylate cyclase (GGDEF)-like protein/PAS domain S-box-containing protein